MHTFFDSLHWNEQILKTVNWNDKNDKFWTLRQNRQKKSHTKLNFQIDKIYQRLKYLKI